MTITDRITTVLDGLGELIEGTQLSQLDGPTPCSEWTVRDLLSHFIGGGHMFAAAYRGATFDHVDLTEELPDFVGPDPLASWKAARGDFESAITEPGALERTVSLPVGPVPGMFAAQLAVADLLIHSWDLATATGQPFDPPADVVAEVAGFAHGFISAELRAAGIFGPEVEPADGASDMERLANYAGRRS